ncbi:hypothetical protein O6H91_14G021300 [Diphasiastrum complanatum]|uniref:Uncharacterized protein n=1 Tax=Diphasiastrum complanatum TaxID=34168 RepID=A0ACC2BN51_DIPCM|nr:hypothetical protein O6H91_14G021300 [Diphasiastrum complanatum]
MMCSAEQHSVSVHCPSLLRCCYRPFPTMPPDRHGGEEPIFYPLGLGKNACFSNMEGEFAALWGAAMRAIGGGSPGSGKQSSSTSSSRGFAASIEDRSFDPGDFFKGKLPGKFLKLLGLLALSRVGVYIPLSGIDRAAFASKIDEGSFLGALDAFSGGGIGRLGISSLGIVPFVDAQIVVQLLVPVIPKLEELQRREGEAGRKKVLQYTRYASYGFAIFQAIGELLYLRPYVDDFTPGWALLSISLLTLGSAVITYISEKISDLKLGSGTSLIIFTNIVSYLPASIGRTVAQAVTDNNYTGLLAILASFFVLVFGIVYVQEAERKIPINYAVRYSGGVRKAAYLPFKVNSSGMMPIIFSTSLLALPSSIARFTGASSLKNAVIALNPGGTLYLPTNIVLVGVFNYLYTFMQLNPADVSEQLKRQGASIPSVRPGKATATFIENVLGRMSVLGSAFLAVMLTTPALVEGVTHLAAFRGFAGTSILILVGCATDTARKVQAELVSQKYKVLNVSDFEEGQGGFR